MKSKKDILDLLCGSVKDFEKAIDIKIRNGQGSTAVKKTLAWVLDD